MPENWVQHPVINTEEGTNPGAPLAWGSPENPDDVVVSYDYDPVGQVLAVHHPNGSTTTYEYDLLVRRLRLTILMQARWSVPTMLRVIS